MRNFPIIVLCLLSLALVLGVRSSEAQQKMHPTFKTLLKLKPRNGPIIAPSVPRITANQAYNLMMQGKAVLFNTKPSGKTVVGAYKLPELSQELVQKLNQIKNKYIILFCD